MLLIQYVSVRDRVDCESIPFDFGFLHFVEVKIEKKPNRATRRISSLESDGATSVDPKI